LHEVDTAGGVKGYRFTPPTDVFADVARNQENDCFCPAGPPCSPNGLFNISLCQFGVYICLHCKIATIQHNEVLNKVPHFEIKYNICSILLHSMQIVTKKNVPAYLFILYPTLITSETYYNRNELDVKC
jgi:hypothetical protein